MESDGKRPATICGEAPKAINRLKIEKVIYNSGKKTEDDVAKIINLAIQTHLDRNPDLILDKVQKSIKNPDRSVTVPISFIYKKRAQ